MTDHSSLHPSLQAITEIIGQRFSQSDFDLIDVIAVPMNDGLDTQEIQQYLVQVKPKRKTVAPTPAPNSETAQLDKEQVYLADGSLNVPFLFKNAKLLVNCGEVALAKKYLSKNSAGRPIRNKYEPRSVRSRRLPGIGRPSRRGSKSLRRIHYLSTFS